MPFQLKRKCRRCGNALLVIAKERILVAADENAQTALDQGKTKTAFNVIGAFRNEVKSLIASRKITPAQGDPLLNAVDLLLQSLEIGGGF
ncbi:MAG TPA: hypothetical protein VE988_01465 [Gemmataceae bacterium]|nr:hypothetical protein [Gemmataceae bacterium]